MDTIKIGIIGGSGIYQIESLTNVKEVEVDTPFGKPSDKIITGFLNGTQLAFLARHGRGHHISPTEVNSRANIFAMKKIGVQHLIAISACGSLQEDLKPRHIVIPDQIYDNTRHRDYSFFGKSMVAHIPFAEPFCPELSTALATAVENSGATVHSGGTYICIEGPRFSTKAESNLYRKWGMDIIGMTAVPEAQLAREAGMCYAMMAHVTDYDCWHESEESVSVEMIIENLLANAEVTKTAIKNVLPQLKTRSSCECHAALKNAIMTNPAKINAKTKADLALLTSDSE